MTSHNEYGMIYGMMVVLCLGGGTLYDVSELLGKE
jgi:hypothetical protein